MMLVVALTPYIQCSSGAMSTGEVGLGASDGLVDLIHRGWADDQYSRPSAPEILEELTAEIGLLGFDTTGWVHVRGSTDIGVRIDALTS